MMLARSFVVGVKQRKIISHAFLDPNVAIAGRPRQRYPTTDAAVSWQGISSRAALRDQAFKPATSAVSGGKYA